MGIRHGKDIMITSRLRLLLPVSLLFFLLISGCKDSTQPKNENAFLLIDLLYYFEYDSVQVELDDEVLYLGRITTSPFTGGAARFGQTVSTGYHRVKFVLFFPGLEVDTTFNLQDALYVEIGYDRAENELLVYFSDSIYIRH